MIFKKIPEAFVLLTTLIIQFCDGADILFLGGLGSKSHRNFYNGIIYALADNGHKVTILSSYKTSKENKNIEDVILPEEYQLENYMPNVFKDSGLKPVIRILDFMPHLCASSLETDQVQDLYERKFDLVLIAMFMNECYYSLIHQLQVPHISVLPAGLVSPIANLIGNPHFPSFAPDVMFDLHHPLTFAGRFQSVVGSLIMDLLMNKLMLYRFESVCRASNACPSDAPSLSEIKSNCSAVIINSIRILESSMQAYMPNIIHAGGIHCSPSGQLPPDLKKWADESGDAGFIFFSLGSAARPSDMPEHHRKTLIKVFGSLKQRVLWKWDQEQMDDLPSNVRLGKWLPQQDIFGHPKLKLFITHGGLHSVQESMYHGVNIIGLPLFADQTNNLKEVEHLGWGKTLEWADLTYDSLKKLIDEVIDNKKMKSIVKKRSELMMDQIRPPQEDVVYWIEYIVRHGGADHLKSPVVKMAWYELYNIDVHIILIIILLVSLIVEFLLLRCCCRFIYRKCCGSKKKKSKRE